MALTDEQEAALKKQLEDSNKKLATTIASEAKLRTSIADLDNILVLARGGVAEQEDAEIILHLYNKAEGDKGSFGDWFAKASKENRVVKRLLEKPTVETNVETKVETKPETKSETKVETKSETRETPPPMRGSAGTLENWEPKQFPYKDVSKQSLDYILKNRDAIMAEWFGDRYRK